MSLTYPNASLALLILGLTAAAPAPRAPVQQPMDDPTALAMFEAIAAYDIQTGGLAAKKATNADVRQLGSTFEQGHKGLVKQTQEAAKKMNLKPKKPKDIPLAAEHAAAMKQLNAATGEEFDRAWIANEVRYHTDAIKVLNDTLMPAIQSPELKSLVQGAVPAFQAHLAAAQQLATKYHVSS